MDDANFLSMGENHLRMTRKVWELTKEFDKLAGSKTNDDKTKLYASDKDEQPHRWTDEQLSPPGPRLLADM